MKKRREKLQRPLVHSVMVCGKCNQGFETRSQYDEHQCSARTDKIGLPVPTPPPEAHAMVRSLAGELIASTALSTIQSDVRAIVRRMDEHNQNIDALNRTLGDFKTKTVEPIKEELKHLRYNMGPKVEQTTTELAMFVNQMNNAIIAMFKSAGWSDEKIEGYREQFGLNSVDSPRSAEFTAYAEQVQELRDQCQTLTEQNQRLIDKLRRYEGANKKRRARAIRHA